jgi:DNA (cytosine-5)-methyltransferase 1
MLGRAVAGQIVQALGLAPKKPKKKLVPSHGVDELLSFGMSAAARYFSVSSTVIAQRTRKTYEKNEDRENANA